MFLGGGGFANDIGGIVTIGTEVNSPKKAAKTKTG
jgi:hypothetical protein